nr:hypothetical protein Q903MT_gene5389 [Picea sitchensis]
MLDMLLGLLLSKNRKKKRHLKEIRRQKKPAPEKNGDRRRRYI